MIAPYLLETVNYSGHAFAGFYVGTSHSAGPGWFIYGRNSEKYGTLPDGRGAYTMLCARPDVAPRRFKYWNGTCRRGWHTKREAMAIAAALNVSTVQS